jgi:16S rRNA (cytosine1402-N4)-methyltransferase
MVSFTKRGKMAILIAMTTHIPVMLSRVIELLVPEGEGAVFVDATLGEGGYAEEILARFPNVRYLGVEIDPAILEIAKERLAGFGERIRFFNAWFTDFFLHYADYAERRPIAALFDLGISRFHYERSDRGFSFSRDEKLDMRLDPGGAVSAETLVNDSDEKELARIFFTFGEERWSRQIARAIARARKLKRIELSSELARIVERAVPRSAAGSKRIHPATRIFQALRIAVNDELVNLETGIRAAFSILGGGGRIGVISYHSLEDRIAKRFFNEKKSGCTCPPEWPICKCGGKKELIVLTKKPLYPDEEEITANRASRSARLRVAEKLGQEGDAA